MTSLGLATRFRERMLPRVPRSDGDLWYGLVLTAAALAVAALIWRATPNFWYDEAMLVQALRADGWLPPGIPMGEYEQAAPYGAYLVQKAMVTLVGFHENLLRAPSLVAYVASGLVVWRGARTLLGPGGAFFAGLVTLTAGVAVRQAAQFKHYEFELLAAAVVLALGLRLLAPDVRRSHVHAFLVSSLAAILFSNSAIIVFGATIAAVILIWLTRSAGTRPPLLRPLFLGAAGVLAMFAAWYVLVLRPALRFQLAYPTYSAEGSFASFQDLVALLPIPSGTYEAVFWSVVLTGGVLCGLVRRDLLPVLAAPVLTVAIAGAGMVGGFVPFAADRHLLFLVPGLAVIAACAGSAIVGLPFRGRPLRGTAAVLAAVLGLHGAVSVVPATAGNGTVTHQAVGYALTSSASQCSTWWVDWWAQPAAVLYADRAGLTSRLRGTVSPVSGLGLDAWAYRLQNQPQEWQRQMVDHFRSDPAACLLVGSRPDEVALALDPLRAAGLPCERVAQMQDAELFTCRPDRTTA